MNSRKLVATQVTKLPRGENRQVTIDGLTHTVGKTFQTPIGTLAYIKSNGKDNDPSRIGEGGTACVRGAIHTPKHGPPQLLAIKKMEPHGSLSEEYWKLLEHEFGILQKLHARGCAVPQPYYFYRDDNALHHKKIKVKVDGEWEEQRVPSGKRGLKQCLAMEFIEGDDLFDCIADRTLSQKEALELVPKIIKKVEVIHALRIAISDLKPENIKIKRDRITGKWEPYFIDFESSYDETESADDILHARTQAFSPPEYDVLPGSLHATRPGDVYSLGLIIASLLCGKFPPDKPQSHLLKIKYLRDNEKSFIITHKEKPPINFLSFFLDIVTDTPDNRPTAQRMCKDWNNLFS